MNNEDVKHLVWWWAQKFSICIIFDEVAILINVHQRQNFKAFCQKKKLPNENLVEPLKLL